MNIICQGKDEINKGKGGTYFAKGRMKSIKAREVNILHFVNKIKARKIHK